MHYGGCVVPTENRFRCQLHNLAIIDLNGIIAIFSGKFNFGAIDLHDFAIMAENTFGKPDGRLFLLIIFCIDINSDPFTGLGCIGDFCTG